MITLIEDTIVAKTTKHGHETITLPAGQWIQIRYGTPNNQTDMILLQVPQGKQWVLTANLYIEENTA